LPPHRFSDAAADEGCGAAVGLVGVAAKGHVLAKQHLFGLEVEQIGIPGAHPGGTPERRVLIFPSVHPSRKKYFA
jgi:hypothetical protein